MTVQKAAPLSSLIHLFLNRVNQSTDRPALWLKRQGKYEYITWREFADRVKKVALFLSGIGVRKGDRVGILSENRPEWAYVDLGILSMGAVTVPIYPTSSVKECCYILEHAEVVCLFISSDEQLEKVRGLLQGTKLKRIIGFDLTQKSTGIGGFTDCLEAGRLSACNEGNSQYDLRCRSVTRDDVATLIYTSGTTGPPKGVMLTHGNFLSNCEASAEVLTLDKDEIALSFLPLSHVFERMAGYYYMIMKGVEIAYAENMTTVPEDIQIVKPTVAASVPRLYEKIYAKIMEAIQSAPPLKQKIFYGSLGVGRKMAGYRQKGIHAPLLLSLQYALARILVFKKLKQKLGGRIKFFISGGAPLAKELAEFFYAADVLILEGYGLTETSPVISVNRPKQFKFGTVGPPIPGVEVKIAKDGEILTRGPHIMKGYFKNDEATREVIKDGWFYTGDLGEIDSDGFLKITGRKKDLIITAGGKNISPQNLENEILTDCLFSQVVILGDRKPYLVALIVPNRVEIERICEERGILAGSWDELLCLEAVKRIVAERLEKCMKDFAVYEQIKYFKLLSKEFTQASGEMTPTMKIKRKVVMEKYASMIEELYVTSHPFAKA